MAIMKTQRIYGLTGTFFLASCFLLLAGACDEADRSDMEIPAREVVLNFDASVVHTEDPETRSVTTMDAFSGINYKFGLSITKNNAAKGTIFTGSDDLTATMQRATPDDPSWEWSFKKTAGAVVDAPLKGPAGKPLKVIAYYPASEEAGAFTAGIPFDFTATSSPKQSEILYNTLTSPTITATGDGSAVNIPLKFQHAYSWIVIHVTKYVASGDPVNLSGATIDNLSGDWIKNQGKISPETGLAMEGSVSGPIGEVRGEEPLDVATPITYQFLVPSFMDADVKDGDVIIALNINGGQEVFSLNREHLNQVGTTYGFQQGIMNTYNLEFNNSSMSLHLVDWTSTTMNGNFGADIAIPWNYTLLTATDYTWPKKAGGVIPFPPAPTGLTADEHPYTNYLTTVALGGNGSYVPQGAKIAVPDDGKCLNVTDYEGLGISEGILPKLYVTTKDINIEQVPWEDEYGVLRAKEVCQKYKGGGMSGWRLPRASELRAILIYYVQNYTMAPISLLGFKDDANQYKNYLTATEVDATTVWAFYYRMEDAVFLNKGPVASVVAKSEKGSVRCVRDYYPTDPK